MQPAKLGAWALVSVVPALLGTIVARPSRAQIVQPAQPAAPSAQQTPSVESSQQTNDRIRALSAFARTTPPHDYIIGSGDVLAIEVFDVPELTREGRVSQTREAVSVANTAFGMARWKVADVAGPASPSPAELNTVL